MEREYKEFKYTFRELKDKIDLIDFFLHQFPEFSYEKKKKGYTLRNTSDDLVDLYLFFNDKGTQKYFNVMNNHGGDLLSFIKNNDLVKNDGTESGYYYNLNVMLHDYIKVSLDKPVKKTIEKVYNDREVFFNYFELTEDITGINEPKNHLFVKDYLNYRQFDIQTLNNRVFKDKLFILTEENLTGKITHKYFSTKIQSLNTGTPVGLTRKNKTFNGIERNSQRGKGFFISNYDNGKSIKELFVFESWEDTVAYFELNKMNEKDNNVFLATSGSYSEQQKSDIAFFIENNNIKKINLCNDNDVWGRIFDLGMICKLTENIDLKYSVLNHPGEIDVPKFVKCDVHLKNFLKINTGAFEMLTRKAGRYNDIVIKDYQKYISGENVSMVEIQNEFMFIDKKDKTLMTFFIPYKNVALKIFNDYIIRTDNKKNLNINIEKSVLKDFNEDLRREKSNLNPEKSKKQKPKL